MKRKRNSNYIQQCINASHAYDRDRLHSLNWNKNEERDGELPKHIDDKQMEMLRKKQEIFAKYTELSKHN